MGNAAAVQRAHDDHAHTLRHGSSKHSRNIDKELAKEKNDNQNRFKILLLGGAESGKTTIFKQMRILHMNGFNNEDIARYRHWIHNNTVEALFALSEAAKALQLPPERALEEELQQFLRFRAEAQQKEAAEENWEISVAMSKVMVRVWESQNMHFLDALIRICGEDYQPSEQDILHCRYRTTGVSEISFVYQKINFLMVDVGGQRTERRKWMHCFDNVDMILFIIAISDYDLLDPEDEKRNRMLQNFEIFRTIVTSDFFRHCAVVLFMNKYDIFREKLTRASLRGCYPEYKGDNSVEDATAFLQKKFRRCISDRHKYYSFETTATDTNQIDLVFSSAVSHIISENLRSTGLHE
ncbi:unnamed protein product, partial [Mesorhabditis spiculigera]